MYSVPLKNRNQTGKVTNMQHSLTATEKKLSNATCVIIGFKFEQCDYRLPFPFIFVLV